MKPRDISTIPLAKIITKAFPFSISFPLKSAELERSLRLSGLLQPITVRRKPQTGRFEVISGARRVMALKRLKHRQVEAFIIDADQDDKALLLSQLYEAVSTRVLNDIERSLAVKKLENLGGYTEKEILHTFCALLDIPRSQMWLRHYMRFADCDEPVKIALVTGAIHREVVCKLLAFDKSARGMLFHVLDTLGCGRNKAHQLLEMIYDISRRDNRSVRALIRSKPIAALLHDERLGKPEKFARIREELYKHRYPDYWQLKKKAEGLVKELALPRSVMLHLPDFFEAKRLRCTIDFTSHDELVKALGSLESMADARACKKLIELL